MDADDAFNSLPRGLAAGNESRLVTRVTEARVRLVTEKVLEEGKRYLIRLPGQQSFFRATDAQALQVLRSGVGELEPE